MKILKLITHWKGFHADDVMAGALLSYFLVTKNHLFDGFSFTRIDYNKYNGNELLSKYTDDDTTVIVYDVGRIYDPKVCLFDHHQYTAAEDNRSSAGMVFDYLIGNSLIDSSLASMLEPLIKKIDENDIGVTPAKIGDFSWIIRQLNIDNDASKKEHLVRYEEAVRLATNIIAKLDSDNEQYLETCNLINNADMIYGSNNNILILTKYLNGWARCLSEKSKTSATFNAVDCVIWYNEKDDTWSANTVQVSPTDYSKKGRSIKCLDPLPTDIIFVHKAEFYAVSKTKDALIKYLYENLR